jgi:hypothetical protein
MDGHVEPICDEGAPPDGIRWPPLLRAEWRVDDEEERRKAALYWAIDDSGWLIAAGELADACRWSAPGVTTEVGARMTALVGCCPTCGWGLKVANRTEFRARPASVTCPICAA